MVDASRWFGDLLPELFAGMPREGLSFPVSYPTSCSPQAWAAASPLLFLRTLLRFEPDIRANKLHLAPAVPDWIGTLRLERIPIMGGHLGVEVTGEVVKVLEVPEDLTIVSDPRRPTIRIAADAPERVRIRSDAGRRQLASALPRQIGRRARERAKSPSGSVHHSTSSMPAARSSRSTRAAGELGADLGAHLLARVELHVELERAHAHGLRARRTQPHLDPFVFGVEHRDVIERVDVEVGAELAVHHAQHVLVELGGDALRVVVRGHRARPTSLTRSVPSRKIVVGAEHRRDVVRGTTARAVGQQVADRAAEEHDEPATAARDRVEVEGEVADDGLHVDARILLLDRGGRVVQRALADVERNEPPERARVAHPVEEDTRLLRRSRAELDERVGVGAPRDLVGPRLEDRALAAASGSTPRRA